jgi:hypothetical protein
MSPLTKAQAVILADLRRLPARCRLGDGTILPFVLETRDARSWQPLFDRGLLVWTERGFKITENDQ